MIDLRNHFGAGTVITGITTIQRDYHIWVEHKGDYMIESVYPHWLQARDRKGRRATFTTGDLVRSGLLDGFLEAGPEARKIA